MNFKDISLLRLACQQVGGADYKSVKELVAGMGAMQAQDYYMSKWAVGIRLQEASDKSVQAAIDKGDIIRTHLLRPTWHLAAEEDVYWMLELTAPQIKTSMKSRHKELGLTDAVIKKSKTLLAGALSGGKHLTREALMSILEKAKISTGERAAHILLCAELDAIICSGRTDGKKQTYALFDERVAKKKSFSREEALGMLAARYYTSHGPATVQDFAWWSGLSATDAKKALEMVKTRLMSAKINGQEYWFADPVKAPAKQPSVYLLPAYDEFIISYRDRSPSLELEHTKKSISSNGIFYPVILVNGQVAGLWKRTIKKDKVLIETDFFRSADSNIMKLTFKAAERFGKFLGLEAEIREKKK